MKTADLTNVYFLRPVGFPGGPIKIGYSANIEMRMRTFAQWSPFELELLTLGRGGLIVERRLHLAFAADRLHFEWFRSSARLLSLVEDVRASGMRRAFLNAGLEWPFSAHSDEECAVRREDAA